MNCKGCGRRLPVPICLEGLRKTTKRRSESSQSCGRDLNPEPPEYKAGVLVTRLLFSVRNHSDTDVIIIPSGGMTVSDIQEIIQKEATVE
jgi:hypothetical protein